MTLTPEFYLGKLDEGKRHIKTKYVKMQINPSARAASPAIQAFLQKRFFI